MTEVFLFQQHRLPKFLETSEVFYTVTSYNHARWRFPTT